MDFGISELVALAAVFFAGAAAVLVFRLSRRLDAFFHGGKAEDLESIIAEVGKRLRATEDEFKRLRNDVARIDVMAGNSVQKVGVVRFNPFEDVGGDQSFAIALLDFEDNGAVLSSLYTREGTRVYAKQVVKGQSRHHLSHEEEEAIRRAIQRE
ncbi:MAG: DUF4446 family protein [Candidatus Terrybacteria bacterium]|nr:DUF4446 family protein [Candidatus Terrybacteria bacterium]